MNIQQIFIKYPGQRNLQASVKLALLPGYRSSELILLKRFAGKIATHSQVITKEAARISPAASR
jgi:hypothetical protein